MLSEEIVAVGQRGEPLALLLAVGFDLPPDQAQATSSKAGSGRYSDSFPPHDCALHRYLELFMPDRSPGTAWRQSRVE